MQLQFRWDRACADDIRRIPRARHVLHPSRLLPGGKLVRGKGLQRWGRRRKGRARPGVRSGCDQTLGGLAEGRSSSWSW